MTEPTKQAFLATWPGGYTENFDVYERVTGGKEDDIVARCIEPFSLADGTALEIGCGNGFWVNRHLLPRFAKVIGIDLIPSGWVVVPCERFEYIEVPDRNYECHGIADSSIDFAWSFGCFCHLTLESVSKYLTAIIRVLKPGAKASLFFSNTERRPCSGTEQNSNFDSDKHIIWCENNWKVTSDLMTSCGFENVLDLMPKHKDTMAFGQKAAQNLST